MPDPEIERFFDRYAAAALSGEPQRTADLYAPGFIAAGPQGSAVFANDDRFLDWLRSVHEFNRRTGMTSMRVMSIDDRRVSETHCIATVEWGATFAATGEALVRFEITYLLERAPDGWLVLAYVSHADQEAEMRRLGLI